MRGLDVGEHIVSEGSEFNVIGQIVDTFGRPCCVRGCKEELRTVGFEICKMTDDEELEIVIYPHCSDHVQLFFEEIFSRKYAALFDPDTGEMIRREELP